MDRRAGAAAVQLDPGAFGQDALGVNGDRNRCRQRAEKPELAIGRERQASRGDVPLQKRVVGQQRQRTGRFVETISGHLALIAVDDVQIVSRRERLSRFLTAEREPQQTHDRNKSMHGHMRYRR